MTEAIGETGLWGGFCYNGLDAGDNNEYAPVSPNVECSCDCADYMRRLESVCSDGECTNTAEAHHPQNTCGQDCEAFDSENH